MNVGIDIDGVLTDIHGFNLRHATPYFRRKFGREAVDKNAGDIRDIFKCPDSEWMSYWKKYLPIYVTVEPARKGAKAFVRTLRNDGHNIFIITKRIFTCRQGPMGILMRTIVRNWLWRNGIRYHGLIFCEADVPDSKKTVCIEKNIDVMIDDEPVNLLFVAPVAKAICFDASYNRECSGENIFRVKNFDEAYYLICKEGGQRG